MKNLLKIALSSLTIFGATGWLSSAHAAPLITISDNLDLYLKGAVIGQYNSNILSSAGGPGKESDQILTLAPGVELDYGRNTDTTLNVTFVEDFLLYQHHTALNQDLANVNVTASRVQGPFTINANFSYIQNYTNTPTFIIPGVPITTIIRSDDTNAGTKMTYQISEKFYADLGFEYSMVQYQGAAGAPYNNSQTYYLPANFYYSYSEKLDIGVAYYFNYTQPQNSYAWSVAAPPTPPPASFGVTRYDNFGGLSMRIKQWEKITGSINVGVDQNHIDAIPGAVVTPAATHYNGAYGVKLQYDYSPKLSFYLNGLRNFQTGAQGQNIQVTTAALAGHYAYSDFVSADATFIGWSHSQYYGTPRVDTAYNAGFAINWTPTTYLVLSAGYSYFMNSSNAIGATYNINLVSISATVRY
jgi:hypothetical protein